MSNALENALGELIGGLASLDCVQAIGLSGSNWSLPEPGEGDIDLFVYCNAVPTGKQRRKLLKSLPMVIQKIQLDSAENGHWGVADRIWLDGVETWLMFFTVTEASGEMEAVLEGKYPGRLDLEYYPIGRCAMWKAMRVLYDPDGFLQSLKKRLAIYPDPLAQSIIGKHTQALQDKEDLQRAVQRKDVFFYHFALDLALDSFLQALFALNREYFPSRKRSEAYIQGFDVKPSDCVDRLKQVIRLGGQAETLTQSYQILECLVQELLSLL